jgi:hypothetical protein
MSETYRLLKSGAASLREAARCFEAIFRARGDDEHQTIQKLINRQREIADELEARANEIGISREIQAWSKGQREAMKNYHPAKPQGKVA